jgi:hypothetical protein
MRSHDLMKSEEAHDAAWEAARGAFTGAAKWGIATAILGAVGYAWSPVYRGTTIQFKVYEAARSEACPQTDLFDSYIQMSGMVLGSMINADHSLREYEQNMRAQRRWMKERAKWERYEEEISSTKGNGK